MWDADCWNAEGSRALLQAEQTAQLIECLLRAHCVLDTDDTEDCNSPAFKEATVYWEIYTKKSM